MTLLFTLRDSKTIYLLGSFIAPVLLSFIENSNTSITVTALVKG